MQAASSVTLPELLPYIQFFGQIALIAAATTAVYQLVMHRRDRSEANALSVLTALQSPEFRHAYGLVWTLPLDASAKEVRSYGKEMEDAVECVMMTFETLGVMVHNRLVPIELVDQVIGGFLRESWRRTRHYVWARRKEVGSRRLAEWFQWLAEHLAVKTRRSRGAYDAFKDWKP